MSDEVIILTFTSANPTMLLMPVTPQTAPAAFAQVIVGEQGIPGSLGETDDIEGFTTDPMFYYILAST